jgi:hypothetical protein
MSTAPVGAIGSPTGTGNPPGKYSERYTEAPEQAAPHFMSAASYKGDGAVERVETGTIVGNQPSVSKEESLEKRSNKTAPYSTEPSTKSES